MNNVNQLTSAQKTCIVMVSAWIDEDMIGKKIDLVWEKDRKCARLGKKEISINLRDSELLQLASLGYVELYLSSAPKSIVFKKTILPVKTNEKGPNDPQAPLPDKVMDVDINQLYVWLIACVVFAIVAVILLVVTINAILDQRISTSVASGIISLVTSIASIVFFKNYDKANDRLKRFRSDPSKNGEERK